MHLLQVRPRRELVISPDESDSPKRVWRRLAQTFFVKGRPGDQFILLSERTTRPGERGLA
ncbi:hypothetical protein DEO72_LG2g2549 [Vigna unguiculata]|uniref:Uncharacterized protein n=1 Tax=Vigna unguiculata TaxID=3917 RepID=A0A4D6L147_VIGUN|nr:hypothetical protein DEO72_LG2g2549 [Vigna unguiculata]